MVSKFCYNTHQNAPTIRDKIHTWLKFLKAGSILDLRASTSVSTQNSFYNV